MYKIYYKYYSVQLNQCREEFHQDKKTFNSEHLNIPGNLSKFYQKHFTEWK